MNATPVTPTPHPSSRASFRDLLALSHIVNGVGSAVGAAIGVIVTARYYGAVPSLWTIIAVALATLLISNGGFIINDIQDLPIDRLNRPDRPLPSGRVTVQTAYILYTVSTTAGLIFAATLGLLPFLLGVLIAGLLYAYSVALKSRYLLGHICIATMGGSLFMFGGAAFGSLIPTAYVAFPVFLAFLGREILKTVPDVEGDRAFGVQNLATRHGVQSAANVGRAFILSAAALLPFVGVLWPMNPAYYGLVIALIIPIAALVLLSARTPAVTSGGQDRAMTNLLQLTKLLFLLVAVALLIGAR